MKDYKNITHKTLKKNLARLAMMPLCMLELLFIIGGFMVARAHTGVVEAVKFFYKITEKGLGKMDDFLSFYIHEGKISPLKREGQKMKFMVRELKSGSRLQ